MLNLHQITALLNRYYLSWGCQVFCPQIYMGAMNQMNEACNSKRCSSNKNNDFLFNREVKTRRFLRAWKTPQSISSNLTLSYRLNCFRRSFQRVEVFYTWRKKNSVYPLHTESTDAVEHVTLQMFSLLTSCIPDKLLIKVPVFLHLFDGKMKFRS